MTNKEALEIIKALESCYTDDGSCLDCPFTNDYDKCVGLMKNALSLIKELTEEKERLEAEKETLEIYNADYKYKNKELTAFNRRWAKECAELQDECEYIKADTVRKMQERLKDASNDGECFDSHGGWICGAVTYETIDQIAKEMLEGT